MSSLVNIFLNTLYSHWRHCCIIMTMERERERERACHGPCCHHCSRWGLEWGCRDGVITLSSLWGWWASVVENIQIAKSIIWVIDPSKVSVNLPLAQNSTQLYRKNKRFTISWSPCHTRNEGQKDATQYVCINFLWTISSQTWRKTLSRTWAQEYICIVLCFTRLGLVDCIIDWHWVQVLNVSSPSLWQPRTITNLKWTWCSIWY